MTGLKPGPVARHLARGLAGFALAGLGLYLLAAPGLVRTPAAVLSLAAAVLLLRGCPACWVAGLIETLRSPERTHAP